MTRERDVEKHLIKRIREKGGEVRKARWLGIDGCPDRRVLGVGWVELKSPTGELSIRQLREIEKMRNHGERVDVLCSIRDVDNYVNGLVF